MNPVAFEILGRPIYWYGLIISIAVLLGIFMAMRNAKALGSDPEMMVDFSLMAIPISIIGARIYYVVFAWDHYRFSLIDIINLRRGGLAIYGAVLGGILTAYIFSRWRKVSFWQLADIAVPSLILGQAIGRWGNYFNQEAFGYAIQNPAWQWFPAAVYIDAVNQWHLATFFYESVWNFCVFFFLMAWRSRRKVEGELLLFYLILYSAGRLVIEGLRTDSLYWGPIRVSQLLSGILIVIGIVLLIYRRRRPANNPAAAEMDSLSENDPGPEPERESVETVTEEREEKSGE